MSKRMNILIRVYSYTNLEMIYARKLNLNLQVVNTYIAYTFTLKCKLL